MILFSELIQEDMFLELTIMSFLIFLIVKVICWTQKIHIGPIILLLIFIVFAMYLAANLLLILREEYRI